ncbi:hypothetical protein EXN66_Car013027 [Channa argus]|uniref:Uncharacterized protein n=1 Tax=Channa argus TaxID=215402 RepID=A0A6G1Q4B3_CHAAH|nr:hypothetical protein EXN66_Car013027 [Channa argus]
MTEREREREREREKKIPATMQRKTCPSASRRFVKVEALQDWNLSNTESSRACIQLHNSCNSPDIGQYHRHVKQQPQLNVHSEYTLNIYCRYSLFECLIQ